MTDNLDSIADQIRQNFSVKDAARERVLPLCREVIHHCGNSIRAVHRQEFELARDLLQSARKSLDKVKLVISEGNELSGTGYIRDAQKEFTEGNITLALITGQKIPGPDELGVDGAAYLNGLGEVIGELRRYLLDSMRHGDLSRGEELLSVMDDIYSVLVTIDFPDAITGGLRRTTDMVRGILERTRSDLSLAIRQKELEERLNSFEREGEMKGTKKG